MCVRYKIPQVIPRRSLFRNVFYYTLKKYHFYHDWFRLVDDLKDENEQYRKMVMESIEKIMGGLGAADVDSRLEEQLIDGILYAFQVRE